MVQKQNITSHLASNILVVKQCVIVHSVASCDDVMFLSFREYCYYFYVQLSVCLPDTVCVYYRPEELPADFYKVTYNMESAVKRKTLLKNGKKPSVSTYAVSYV